MKYIIPLFTLIMLVCASGCNQYDAPLVTGSIAGFVTPIDESGATLARDGVKVTIEEAGKSAMTNSDGYWIINDIPAGIYTISFSKNNFSTNKVVAYQFVGNGTAFITNTQLPIIPPYNTTIDSVWYDTTSDPAVVISGSMSRPQPQNRTVLLFMNKQTPVTSNPKEYSSVVTSFVSALSTNFTERIPVTQFVELGYPRGSTVYITSYATSKLYYRYVDIETGRNYYSGIMPSGTNRVSVVVP